jgi:hypothetical protein
VIIDKQNPIAGIKELRYIDPRKLRKVREIKKKKDEVGDDNTLPLFSKALEVSQREIKLYNDVLTSLKS